MLRSEARIEARGSLRKLVRVLKCAAIFVIILGLIGAVAWFNRVPLLRGAVDLWAISDPVTPADAVAVLGGGVETRPVAAAEYYRSGLVKKILLSNVRTPALSLDVLPSETELNHRVLVKLGVPEAAIELFGNGLSSTYEEASALREWALRSHARKLIVPTEYFSSRRVRWILSRELVDTGTQVQVPALDDPEYPRIEWWKNEKGLLIFQNEIIKYFYYRIKY